jgi:hypothetical protein
MRWTLWRQRDSHRVDENAKAYGEVVWSWRRDPGVYPVRLCGHGNGDNKGRSPGRARISRKAVARGKPGCFGCTCQIRVRCFAVFAHGGLRAQSAPGFPCALFEGRANELASPGRKRVAGMRTHVSPSLRGAKRRSNPWRRKRRSRLLRGACHPAALRADQVARNDGCRAAATSTSPSAASP